MKIFKDFADSFSLSFHPMIIPFYTLIFIFILPIFQIQAMGKAMQISILVIAGLSTIVMPIVSMYFLKKKKIISSYKLENKNERFTPYIYTTIYYGITTYMLHRIELLPDIVPLIFAIPTVVIILLIILNFRIKASAHAAGMGSINAIIYVLMHVYSLDLILAFQVSFILTFLVIISRKYLNAHSWAELIIGYIIGGGISLLLGFWIL